MITVPNTKAFVANNFFDGMKHKLRDSIIFIIDTLGISFLYRRYLRAKGPLVRVIAFHDVADAVWFEAVINLLVSQYHVITPEQFRTREFHPDKVNILLTFDDGYQSWIDTCVPILERFKLKGLFFINSGLLEGADDTQKTNVFMKDRLHITLKNPLSWKGVSMLVACGHTIGGHTITHPDLSTLTEEDLNQEIHFDKKNTEQMLGSTLIDFAYPFGTSKHFNRQVIACAKRAEYLYQYSAISGFYDHTDGPIHRTLLEKNQPISQINRWIKGGYDIFSAIK